MKLKKIAALLAAAGPMVVAAPAFATNAMNMEGYGPVATAMGGASMAYDNGTAGLINNPATLGLMKSGTSRLDVALGGLHPDVNVAVRGMGSADSGGNAYFMPAIGYVRKDGGLTWGVGMMSQGGMGTEWSSGSVMSAGGINTAGAPFGAFGLTQRSELGVGRVIFPLVFDVSDTVRVGGTIDYVWGGMDFQMALDGNTFNAMGANFGNANKTRVGYIGAKTTLAFPAFDLAYISANRGTDKFSQQLTTSGAAVNLGMTWQATPALAVGAVYHARTSLSDMSGSASMTVGNAVGGALVGGTFNGTMKVVNFQWPETFGVGLSYKASDKWQFVADYKNIGWAKVMQQFHMIFSTAAGVAEFGLNMNWKDQDVVQLGAAYKVSDSTTLRFGVSLANQPIEAENMIPIFPAIVTNHFTVGAGFALDKASSLDFSLSHAPNVSLTNTGVNSGRPVAGPAVSAGMSQTNWQLMYSQRF